MGLIRFKVTKILLMVMICFSVYPVVFAEESKGIDFYDYGECFKHEVDEKKISKVVHALSGIKYDSYKYSVRSQCFYKLKKYKLAYDDISAVIDNDPELPMVHQHRGKINFEMKNYNGAINDLSHAIENELNSQDNEAYFYLSNSYQNINKLKEAENVLLNLLVRLNERYSSDSKHSDVTRIHYDEIPVYLALTKLYEKQNKTDKAIKLLTKGVQENNGSVELFDQLMFLLKETNNMEIFAGYKRKKCNKPLIMRSQYCNKRKQKGVDSN